MSISINRAKVREVVKVLRAVKCDNFRVVGVSVPYLVHKLVVK